MERLKPGHENPSLTERGWSDGRGGAGAGGRGGVVGEGGRYDGREGWDLTDRNPPGPSQSGCVCTVVGVAKPVWGVWLVPGGRGHTCDGRGRFRGLRGAAVV